MKEEFNREYWNKFYQSPEVVGSQNDLIFQDLSHRVIMRSIEAHSNILVAGCGNGHGFDIYSEFSCTPVGFDFSSTGIESALNKYPQFLFTVRDMTQQQDDLIGKFNYVITERSLTNLSSRDIQRKTILLLLKYLSPGGKLIICEPYLSGYKSINLLRQSLRLSPLAFHDNAVFGDDDLFEGLPIKVETTVTFGVYTLISRVIYPAMIFPEAPKFQSSWNGIAAQLCLQTISDEVYNHLPSQHKLWIIKEGGE
jgi:hypothetical protein